MYLSHFMITITDFPNLVLIKIQNIMYNEMGNFVYAIVDCVCIETLNLPLELQMDSCEKNGTS